MSGEGQEKDRPWGDSPVCRPGPPSIFNDVIGPVMRGPSSSHCAAAVRIGRMARDLMGGRIEEISIEFDRKGSLSMTHETQGSDMGLMGGLLGWDAADERLPGSLRAVREAGIRVRIEISDFEAEHPNTYRLTLGNPLERHSMTAVSSGGGMIEVVELDGAAVSMAGDCFETLIYCDSGEDDILGYLRENVDADGILLLRGTETRIIEVRTRDPLKEEILSGLDNRYGIKGVKTLAPVLPVLAGSGAGVPFSTCQEMLFYNEGRDLELWELAVHYESARSGMSHEEVFDRMGEIVGILRRSILLGLKGTAYGDRILGCQSERFRARMEENRLLDAGMLNRIILYVSAMMEMKSSMGVIVAAPTAGACGGLPGACIGAAEAMGLSQEDMIKAMLAAGVIGLFIAARATFAAETGGCQAECGAGSGMAAAALVTLAGGTVKQAICASSMALQNILGMICDPVAGRVEVPCLGRNVMAACSALGCANMALADYDEVIPLDEVIETMDRVGRSLPSELRCTALGGLSTTRTSREIEKRLRGGTGGRHGEDRTLHHAVAPGPSHSSRK